MNTSLTTSHRLDRLEAQSTLREKGQLTLPTDIREILNLQEGDRVAFIVNAQKRIEVIKKPSVVAQTAGILRGTKPTISAEDLRVQTERAMAEAAIERGK